MPNRYQDDSEFHVEDLAIRHLEGDLTPSEYDAFEERIQKDPEAREALINLCLDATAIREMQEEVLEKILGNSEDDSNSKPDDPQVGFDSPPSRWPDPPLVFGAISFSSILFLITGLTAMYLFSARSVPTNNLTQYVCACFQSER